MVSAAAGVANAKTRSTFILQEGGIHHCFFSGKIVVKNYWFFNVKQIWYHKKAPVGKEGENHRARVVGEVFMMSLISLDYTNNSKDIFVVQV